MDRCKEARMSMQWHASQQAENRDVTLTKHFVVASLTGPGQVSEFCDTNSSQLHVIYK